MGRGRNKYGPRLHQRVRSVRSVEAYFGMVLFLLPVFMVTFRLASLQHLLCPASPSIPVKNLTVSPFARSVP